MKSLYDENEKYSNDAFDLDRKVEVFTKNLFDEFIARGYRIREISHVIHAAVDDQELEHILDKDLKRERAREKS